LVHVFTFWGGAALFQVAAPGDKINTHVLRV
jgi:hypothetical protein